MSESTWHADDHLLLDLARQADGARPPPPAISGYEGLVEIARGGQGVVYRAIDQRTGQHVAVKVLGNRLAAGRARRRFEREIEIVTTLRHPHIVRVIDSGLTDDEQLFLVMEYLDGLSLDLILSGRSDQTADDPAACRADELRTVEPALRMFLKICDAVHHAHQKGVLHRDLKPSNILLVGGEPYVLDFGVARVKAGVDRPRADSITCSGEFLGSLPWASPELVAGGEGDIDLRSDVYALGVILFQMLTGRFPYDVQGPLHTVVDAIVTAAPTPPGRIRSDLPDDLSTIVLRCLAKDPAERYQSVGDLARDVRLFLAGEPIEARREHALRRMQRSLRRHRRVIVYATAAAIILLAASIYVSLLLQRAVEADRLAREQRDEAVRQRHTAEAAMGFLTRMIESADPIQDGRPLDPALRHMLDSARRRLDGELAGQPLVQAVVARSLGRTCYHLGMLVEADELLEKSISIYQAALQSQPRRSADVRSNRLALAECLKSHGMVNHAAGRFQEAETSLRQAIAIMEQELGPDMDWSVFTEIDLAVTFAAQGRYDDAERLLKGTLARLHPSEAVRNHAIGLVKARLAELAQARDDHAEADRCYTEAAAELRARLGSQGLELADCLERFATLRIEQGRTAEAVELSSQALAIYRGRLSADHWRIGLCLTTLGDACLQAHDAPRGIQSLQDGFQILRASLGEQHPFTARARALLKRHGGSGVAPTH